MIHIRVKLAGVLVALVFSLIGTAFIIMSGYSEFVFLIIILWILIPVVIAKLYNRIKRQN